IHADGVLRARLHAQAADDAAQLIDHEAGRVLLDDLALVGRVGRLVLTRLDVDALRRADGRAHVAGHAARLAVLARDQPVQAAVARRLDHLLFGVLHRGDTAQSLAVDDLHVGVARPEEVAEEELRGDRQTLGEVGQVGANADLAAGIPGCLVGHGSYARLRRRRQRQAPRSGACAVGPAPEEGQWEREAAARAAASRSPSAWWESGRVCLAPPPRFEG